MSQNSLEHLRVIVEINKPEEYNDDFNNNNISMNSTLNNNSTMKNNNSLSQVNCNSSWSSSTMNRRSSVSQQYKRQLQLKRRTSCSLSPPLPTSGGHMKTEVIILDEKTIKLNMRESEVPPHTEVSQKMQFDRVNYMENNDMIREELDNLMSELIANKKHCCIMRFACQHDMSLILFYDRLIDQFDRKLHAINQQHQQHQQDQQYKLQQCHLETQDIASMDECQMSVYSESQDPDYESGGHSTPTVRRRNHFRKTGEMLLWLLNEHRLKSQAISGHELLTFTFIVSSTDARTKGQCIALKLHLFNVYCSMMMADERLKWPNFLKNIGRNCCLCSNCNFHYSPLFMKLLPHFDTNTNQFGLIMFQIPNGHDQLHVQDTIEMLQMAHALVKDRRPTNRPSLSSLRSFSVDSLDGNETAGAGSNAPSLANSMTERRKSIAFTISFDDDAEPNPLDMSTASSFSFSGRRQRRPATVASRMVAKMPELDANNNNNSKSNSNNISNISNKTNNLGDDGRTRRHNVDSNNSSRTISNRLNNNNNNNNTINNNNSRVGGRRTVGNSGGSFSRRNGSRNSGEDKRSLDTGNSLYQHHYQSACKWFDKIERCYSNVYRTREIFYKQYFIQNITVMMRYVGQICTTYLPSPTTADEDFELFAEPFVTEAAKRALRKYYRRYAAACRDFVALPEEIMETPYVNTLTSYYEQKQQELNQQEAALKLKHFEEVKKDLCYVVDEEIINVRGEESRGEGGSSDYDDDPSVEEDPGTGEYQEYDVYEDGGEIDDEADEPLEVEELDDEQDEDYEQLGDAEQGGNDGDVFY